MNNENYYKNYKERFKKGSLGFIFFKYFEFIIIFLSIIIILSIFYFIYPAL